MANRETLVRTFQLLVLLFWIFPTLLSGQTGTVGGSAESKAKQHYLAAVDALKANDLDAAERELNAAAALAPSNSVIWYNLAVVESRKNNSETALRHLQQAIKLGLPADVQTQAKELQAKLNRASVPTTTASSNKPQNSSNDSQTSSDLKYFVGTWAAEANRDQKEDGGCTTHTSDTLRFVITPAGKDRLSMKESYFSKKTSNCAEFHFFASGKPSMSLTEHYEGSIFKEGTDFRMSKEDGTCSGDCEGDDVSGGTYTLQIISQDEFVRLYKPTGGTWHLKRE